MAKGAQPPKDGASPAMKAAWQRLDLGDVASARKQAREILASTPSPEDRAQAEELLARSQTPRVLYAYALLAALVMAVLLTLTVLRY